MINLVKVGHSPSRSEVGGVKLTNYSWACRRKQIVKSKGNILFKYAVLSIKQYPASPEVENMGDTYINFFSQ